VILLPPAHNSLPVLTRSTLQPTEHAPNPDDQATATHPTATPHPTPKQCYMEFAAETRTTGASIVYTSRTFGKFVAW